MRRTVLLLVATALGTFLAWGVAFAAPLSPLADTGTANANGRVSTVLVLGDKVYLGGSFTQVGGVQRNRLAAIDASTGQLTDWNPNANGNVRALAASADGTRVYAGGSFSAVGGASRQRLVSLDASTGAVDAGFKINGLNATVQAIAVSGNSLYIGGEFTSVQGQSRSRLARVDATTAALDPAFDPAPNSTVKTLSLSPDGALLYAGGDFTTISGQPSSYLAGLDPANGALAWQPLTDPNGSVFDVAPTATAVYAAEGGVGGAAASYDATTGTRLFSLKGDGDVQGVAVVGDTLYIGGHFLQFMGNDRRFFAAVDATTGVLDPWNPIGSSGGTNGVWAFEADTSGTRVYAGGDFTKVSGEARQHFARFSDRQPPPACTITGTSSVDTLVGTAEDDVICGANGNDTIKGLGGNDILRGEGGNDQLNGGVGDDTLDGGPGTDAASFADSSGAVSASLMDNTASGDGSDALMSMENLVGSSGADTLTGSDANNSLNGGNGADTIYGQGGADKLTGSGGADTERGGPGNDTVVGSSGADLLFGEDGDDSIDSRDGVNGNDSLDGGPQVNGDTALSDTTEKSIVDFP